MTTRWLILAGLGLMIAGSAAVLIAKFVLIDTKASAVDPQRYLGHRASGADLYERPFLALERGSSGWTARSSSISTLRGKLLL
ncbi:MAG: hypothetical protein ABFD52_08570 [Acidobacteriota bacterium]